jgi:sugar lactone lactonase YvrE
VEIFAEGLMLAECPRWHDDFLYVSDMWGQAIYRYAPTGERETVARVPFEPGGLGWAPDGALLVVGMDTRQLLRVEHDGNVSLFADLSVVAPWQCNDMVVAGDGTAYISQFGYDFFDNTSPFGPAQLIRVTPDGKVDTVADDLLVPNGLAILDDGRKLLVAEPGASRVTAFAVTADGLLRDRTVFATLDPLPGQQHAPPDGICADGDGGVWVAEPLGQRVLHLDHDGTVIDELGFNGKALAVALGGATGQTLYVCVTNNVDRKRRNNPPSSRIITVEL